MKHIFLSRAIRTLLIACFVLFAISGIEAQQVNTQHTKQIKIAYVTDPVGECYPKDIRILPALKANPDFVITEINGKLKNNDYSSYDLIILSEVLGSTAEGLETLKGINKPFLMMKVHAYKPVAGAWNWTDSKTAYGQDTMLTNIVVSNKLHPIFKGVAFLNTNEVQMLTEVVGPRKSGGPKGITYMNPQAFLNIQGGTIISLAAVNNNPTQISILEIPAGTSIAGTLIPQKFIQIGINGLSYKKVSDDALKIIQNACYYLVER